ncbi:MAG TPA: SIR2 family protein [Longimicrobiaceae bacterium]|nr:SIR2 family protein [Longimicrobiaceae bacterium]
MADRTLDDLVRDLADRRRLGEQPPVVLLGAGASAAAGLATMPALYEFTGVAGFDEFVAYLETRNENERYRLLSDFLQTQDPHEVTPGYRALAALCEHAYFDVVLTTNFDPLLDDALSTARLRRKDYLLLINGVLRPDRLRWLLSSRSPRVKVVKLHGDLFHRFMAWTPAEMDDYLRDIGPSLAPFLATRDFLVVGHSLRDDRIRELVTGADGAVWFVNLSPAPDALQADHDLRSVVGPGMGFEQVFTALAERLGATREKKRRAVRKTPRKRAGRGTAESVGAAAAPGLDVDLGDIVQTVAGPDFVVEILEKPRSGAAADTAATTDDLAAATVGIAFRDDAPAAGTGFLLAEPRVIVTDGYLAGAGFDPEHIGLVTGSGRRLTTRALGLATGHPSGPWLLEAPAGLSVRGLRASAEPLAKGEALQFAVAAGERTGLASGVVVTGRLVAIPVDPMGRVPDLVHVRAVLAPGSSGAPAVDDELTVRGFVAAGSSDPAHPDTYVHPAQEWLTAVLALGGS